MINCKFLVFLFNYLLNIFKSVSVVPNVFLSLGSREFSLIVFYGDLVVFGEASIFVICKVSDWIAIL